MLSEQKATITILWLVDKALSTQDI